MNYSHDVSMDYSLGLGWCIFKYPPPSGFDNNYLCRTANSCRKTRGIRAPRQHARPPTPCTLNWNLHDENFEVRLFGISKLLDELFASQPCDAAKVINPTTCSMMDLQHHGTNGLSCELWACNPLKHKHTLTACYFEANTPQSARHEYSIQEP